MKRSEAKFKLYNILAYVFVFFMYTWKLYLSKNPVHLSNADD